MPIYEYQCDACREVTTVLVLCAGDTDALQCDRCEGKDLRRIVSSFAVHKSEAQRLQELDTRVPCDDTFYKDSRNVGLWAKKRADEMGADLGPDFDRVVERARTASNVEDLET